MSFSNAKTLAIAAATFAMGIAVANLPLAVASSQASPTLAKRSFTVFVDEVKQNLVFNDKFVGSYTKSFTLSDGSKREITLTPVVHNGMQVIELKDTGGITYMSLNGATTDDKLMVRVRDDVSSRAALKEQGWTLPGL